MLLRLLTALHLIISCGSKIMWYAISVYLHHLCLICLAGTDIAFRWPSSMRSQGDTSTTPLQRGARQMKEGVSCIHPFRRSTRSVHQSRRRPSSLTVKDLPLDGSRDPPPPGGRIPGCRYTHPTSPTTHGCTSTTREQEAPRDRSRRAQLRPKA